MTTLKSISFAAALTLATAFGITAGQTIIYPDTAQAGVLSTIKGAAKKVGGAVNTTVKTVGKTAKQAGVGVGSGVKRAAVGVWRSPVGTTIKNVGVSAGRDVKYVVNKVRGR